MTTTQRKAMEKALEALCLHQAAHPVAYRQAISCLRTALAEQPAEQKPVANHKWAGTKSDWVVMYLRNNSIFDADKIGAMLDFASACAENVTTAPHPAVPPGFKMVPVEPTDEMIDAAKNNGAEGSRKEIAGDYKAMLNAAPDAPQPAIPPGYTLVNSGALQMVVNALRRDAAEGKTVRGEMADALTGADEAKNDITGEPK